MSEMTMLYLIIIFILILLGTRVIIFLHSFAKELHYINAEIRRCSPNERSRWVRARRRTWMSLIPFYNRYRRYKRRTRHKK